MEKILAEAKNKLMMNKGRKEQLEEQIKIIEDNLKIGENDIDVFEQVRILLQKTSDYAREQSRIRIEALVTNCLQYIFDSSIEFKIEISEARGRPEAEFYVISQVNGETIKTKPQEARGGGVVDIISLALRLAMLQCSSVEINGPIILDEPAKHVSDEYIVQVAEFLKQISLMFDRQVIMVTHNRHLVEIADKAFKIEQNEGKSSIIIDS
ncbi:MAG: ATPase [Deltaproteobacteria bacterium]